MSARFKRSSFIGFDPNHHPPHRMKQRAFSTTRDRHLFDRSGVAAAGRCTIMFHADAVSHNLVMETFKALDKDGSGTLEASDFGAGPPAYDKRGEAFFNELCRWFDAKNDGKVTLMELGLGLQQRREHRRGRH